MQDVQYEINPQVTNQDLNALFVNAWPRWPQGADFGPVLRRSLGYVCAYQDGEPVGFVNVERYES
jgi:hypothetical protein